MNMNMAVRCIDLKDFSQITVCAVLGQNYHGKVNDPSLSIQGLPVQDPHFEVGIRVPDEVADR